MSNFLLIHGGSHGAWCWDECATQLRSLGHRAVAIDLPGHGADATPRDGVTVDAYAHAIRRALGEFEDSPVTLVGHSLAGVTFARTFETPMPTNVDSVVLISAMVLKSGETAIEHTPEDRRPLYFELAEASPDGAFLLPFEVVRNTFFSDLPESVARRFYEKLTPQPFAVFVDEARTELSAVDCRRTYIACRGDRAFGLQANLDFGRRLGGEILEIDAGHDVMLSKPDELAEMLSGLDG